MELSVCSCVREGHTRSGSAGGHAALPQEGPDQVHSSLHMAERPVAVQTADADPSLGRFIRRAE